MNHFIDAHAHLSDERVFNVVEEAIREAELQGVRLFCLGGFDPADWKRQNALAAKFGREKIRTVLGLHPWWVVATDESAAIEEAFEELKRMISKADALGELGLDFYPKKFAADTHERQIEWFGRQLDLALESQKPLVLHVVSAHEQALSLLKERAKGAKLRGIVHGFSGNVTIARGYVDLGLTLSVGIGVLKNGYENVKRSVRQIGLEHWVLESDAPDQLMPKDVIRVAQAVAELKESSIEEVARVTTENAHRIFSGV